MIDTKGITKIVATLILLVQFPIYGRYFLNSTHEITLENPNPIIQEVQAKEEATLGSQSTEATSPTLSDYIQEVFGEDGDVAIAVAKCESGIDNSKMNDNTKWGGVGRDWGVFQINDHYHANKGDIPNLTERENVRMAKKIFDASGWYAWSAYKNGCYLKFL
jgi:hypothetical protein